MAEFTHQVDEKGTVRYKLDNKFTKTSEVPEDVKTALGNLEPGTVVDEAGMIVEKEEATSTVEQVKTPEETSQDILDSAKATDETPGDDEDEAEEDEAEDQTPSTTPDDLDAVKSEGSRPDVKSEKAVETRREDERPGGPQEPVEAAPRVTIDSAEDVDDESGLDVEEQDRAARARAAVEQDEAGMGFKRVKGKTVDVFDGKTPHTHVRYVAGVMVPLTEENYHKRTDGEIIDKLKKLGKI